MADQADHSQMKLGRSVYRYDPARRLLAQLLFPKLPPPPALVDWTNGHTDWGMMANDRLGDCVFAGGGHLIQIATLQYGPSGMVTPTDSEIVEMYSSWAGYDPTNPSTDRGYVEADFLDKWQANGYCGQALLGHCDTDPGNLTHVRQGIIFYGPAYVGAVLPVSAQSQDIWDVTDHDGGIWGGHAFIAAGYDDARQLFTLITWGQVKYCTYAWWEKYVDECHSVLLSPWTSRYPGVPVSTLAGIFNAVQ